MASFNWPPVVSASSGANQSLSNLTNPTAVNQSLILTAGLAITVGNYHLEPSENDDGNSGTTKTVDWSVASAQKVTLTGNVTYTFSNPVTGGVYVLKQIQGSGPFTATWPASVKWPGGTAPTLTLTSGNLDILTFYYDGTDFFG